MTGSPASRSRRDDPLKPVSPARKVAYGIAFFVVFVAAWSIATFGGFVSKTFLADPLTMLQEGYDALRRSTASSRTSA